MISPVSMPGLACKTTLLNVYGDGAKLYVEVCILYLSQLKMIWSPTYKEINNCIYLMLFYTYIYIFDTLQLKQHSRYLLWTRAPDNFLVQRIFTPWFLTQCWFSKFQWYFHPLYFLAMLKTDDTTVFPRSVHFDFVSNIALVVVHFCC